MVFIIHATNFQKKKKKTRFFFLKKTKFSKPQTRFFNNYSKKKFSTMFSQNSRIFNMVFELKHFQKIIKCKSYKFKIYSTRLLHFHKTLEVQQFFNKTQQGFHNSCNKSKYKLTRFFKKFSKSQARFPNKILKTRQGF